MLQFSINGIKRNSRSIFIASYLKAVSLADLISIVSTAISLATRLREIGKNIQDAEFKNLLADLSLELAAAKLKISDLISENAEMKERLRSFTSATGELCPECNNRKKGWVWLKKDHEKPAGC